MEPFEAITHSLRKLVEHLNKVSTENSPSKLNEAVKKFIAARILVKSLHSSSDIAIERELDSNVQDNAKKLLSTLGDDSSCGELLRILNFSTNGSLQELDLTKVDTILSGDNFKEEIPEDILFNAFNEELDDSVQNIPTAPKSRGRPKKQIVLANTEQLVKESIRLKAKKSQLVFIAIMRIILLNLAQFYNGTTGRIILSAKFSDSDEKFSEPVSEVPKPEPEKVQHRNKKVRLDSYANDRVTSSSPLNSMESKLMDIKLVQNQRVASMSWNFLERSDSALKKLLDRFIELSKISTFNWYKRFYSDRLISDMRNDRSLKELQNEYEKVMDIPSNPDQENFQSEMFEVRKLIQLISHNYACGDSVQAFNGIDQLLSKMKSLDLFNKDDSYLNGDSIDEYVMHIMTELGLKVDFLFFDTLSILRYCVSILMDTLKQHISTKDNVSELALGHAITLSQFDWPKRVKIYKRCIKWIRTNKPTSTTPQCLSDSTKFTYPPFFQYIKNPHIIEDFMALLYQGYTLDIRSSVSSQSSQSSNSGSRGGLERASTRSGKAITTRGTNKSFKEDLKVAIVSQMKNSSIFVPLDCNAEFIQSSLLPYLLETTEKFNRHHPQMSTDEIPIRVKQEWLNTMKKPYINVGRVWYMKSLTTIQKVAVLGY